jgi:hypothetical protein
VTGLLKTILAIAIGFRLGRRSKRPPSATASDDGALVIAELSENRRALEELRKRLEAPRGGRLVTQVFSGVAAVTGIFLAAFPIFADSPGSIEARAFVVSAAGAMLVVPFGFTLLAQRTTRWFGLVASALFILVGAEAAAHLLEATSSQTIKTDETLMLLRFKLVPVLGPLGVILLFASIYRGNNRRLPRLVLVAGLAWLFFGVVGVFW